MFDAGDTVNHTMQFVDKPELWLPWIGMFLAFLPWGKELWTAYKGKNILDGPRKSTQMAPSAILTQREATPTAATRR